MDSVGLNKLLQRDRSPQEPPTLTPSPQSQISDPALRLGQSDDIARTSMPTLTPFTKQPETKNPNYSNNLSQVTAFPSVVMPKVIMPKFATPNLVPSLASAPSLKTAAPKAPAVSVRPLLSSRSETAFRRIPAPSANLGNPPPIMSAPPLEPEQPRISPPAYTSRKSEPRRIEPSRMEVNESITSAAKLQLPPSRKSWAAKTIATPAPTAPLPDLSVKYAPAVSQNLVVDNKVASNKHYAIVAPTRYLAEGRQVEKEAFIRSKDGQIQLGSFRDAESAQRRIDELRQQGIPVDAIKVEAK
jgi:SPOR domain